MRRLTFLLVMMIVIVVGAVFVIGAQDDQGTDNNPATNPRANACYADGTMATQCDTEWEWKCGWYLIRYETGVIDQANFPTDCTVLLPAEVPPVNIISGCLPHMNRFVNFTGAEYLPIGSPSYTDNACTVQNGTTTKVVVYTLNGQGVANALCATYSSYNYTTWGGGGVYQCG